MNENQNPNLGNVNGVPAPGQTPAPVTPVANPNVAAPGVAPVTPVANPNIVPAQAAPAAVAPGQVPVTPAPGQAPAETPVVPAANPNLPGMAPAQAAPVNPVANPNVVTPNVNPAAGNALPGMAPAQGVPGMQTVDSNTGVPAQGGITIDPNAMGTVPVPPAPNAGQAPEEDDGKKFETKTIVLVAVAILAVIFAVVYFLFLNPNKKKPTPAPATNTVENTVNNTTEDDNTTGNTTENTAGNTTPEPEPEPETIEDSDMSWMGSYEKDDITISFYYSAPKVLELEISKTDKNGADTASLTLDVTSLTKLTYDDDYLGDDLKLELTKADGKLTIKGESSNEDSIFNIEEELTEIEIEREGWSGFYQIDGGQIVINEIYKKGGRIDISSESSKYGNFSTNYELKNNKITIKGSSFSKGDTEITKDGDILVVKSKEYLPGNYQKLV